MVIVYEDLALKKPVKMFHLGTVEAGTRQEKTYYVFNNSKAEIHEMSVKFKAGKPKGMTIKLPKFIRPGGKSEMKITWMPPKDLKEPLRTAIEITFKEIYIA